MAHDLNQDSYFTFDQVGLADSRKRVDSSGSKAERLKGLAANRYAMLGLIFILAGALIFYNTAVLQFSGAASVSVSETAGVSRQLTVPANRGDIVDATGIPLAAVVTAAPAPPMASSTSSATRAVP